MVQGSEVEGYQSLAMKDGIHYYRGAQTFTFEGQNWNLTVGHGLKAIYWLHCMIKIQNSTKL